LYAIAEDRLSLSVVFLFANFPRNILRRRCALSGEVAG
jgi:hypothetical protein